MSRSMNTRSKIVLRFEIELQALVFVKLSVSCCYFLPNLLKSVSRTTGIAYDSQLSEENATLKKRVWNLMLSGGMGCIQFQESARQWISHLSKLRWREFMCHFPDRGLTALSLHYNINQNKFGWHYKNFKVSVAALNSSHLRNLSLNINPALHYQFFAAFVRDFLPSLSLNSVGLRHWSRHLCLRHRSAFSPGRWPSTPSPFRYPVIISYISFVDLHCNDTSSLTILPYLRAFRVL